MLDLRELHSAVKREEWPLAWKLANGALNLEPESPEALYLVGCCLRAMGHIGLAHLAFSKAIAKERSQPNLWMNYAATLHDLNRWADAEKAFEVVARILPDDPMPHANIAATYLQRGLWRDALNNADKALALDPDSNVAQITKNFACLALGRWTEGWKYAESQYGTQINIRIYNKPENEEPQWDGSPGKTVVVQCDQGVGDIIMFSQLIPRMQMDCKTVIVECAPRLVNYFKRNFPGTIVYGTIKQEKIAWPADHTIDARIHISLLGKFYLNRDSDFARNPYVNYCPEKYAKWRDWLLKFKKPTVGIAWRGGLQQTQTHIRSIDLDDYKPILERDAAYIDLSYHDSRLEVARWNINNVQQIIQPPVDTTDYEDTIALVAALDDIVTVTTTIAHVCGSLGRKARVLVPHVAQWRYAYRVNEGLEMIWYAPGSVRLFRQMPGETDWSMAINRVAKSFQ